MNSNNWLSFPLSPNHSSMPSHLQASESHHQFSLGQVRDNMDNPFQPQEWNIMNCQASNDVPKVADFLGVSKSDNQSDLVAFNEIQANNVADNYFFSSNNPVPVQSTLLVATGSNNYEFQENASNLQSLTLSMGSANGKGSTCETSGDTSANTAEVAAPRRTLDTFGQRTSIYRGVTRHRWTGRYEAHLWDNSCRREGQSRKGRQVYLGGYDKEEKAARAYDLAALKYWGTSTTTNFPISNYEKEVEEMKNMTRQEFVAAIRRKSSGFSRGASMYRGVTRHHQHGRWQARIGRVAGNKDLYLGTFSTEEEAAEAYDIAAIKFRGLNAVTNFDMNRYDVKSILESNTLPIGGGAAKRLKEAQAIESSRKRDEMIALGSSSLPYAGPTTTSAAARLQAYTSLMHHQQQQQPLQAYDHLHQPQPFLTLQNQHDIYSHEAASYLHLHQAQAAASSGSAGYFHPSYHQFYNPGSSSSAAAGYNLQGSNVSPVLLHGLFNMEGNGGSSGLGGGFGLGIGPNSGGSVGVPDQELAPVKVDYDLPANGGYGGVWSGDSVHGSNPGGVFTTWGD